jgi:uncharacterized cupredoxin-like copper-binding protein
MTTESTPKKSMTMWYIVAAIVIIVVIVAGVVLYEQSLAPSNGGTTPIAVTLYAGEVSSSKYGFGNTANSITSPGPTLTFTQGEEYKMTVNNVGTMAHSWAIANQNSTGATILFSSEINPGAFIAQGQSGSVTFTPNQSGNFYYICPVPGHPELGMWGQVVINSAP